jgi:hypothetical protein
LTSLAFELIDVLRVQVIALLEHNPFGCTSLPNGRPRFIRTSVYAYEFAPAASGMWWSERLVGLYTKAHDVNGQEPESPGAPRTAQRKSASEQNDSGDESGDEAWERVKRKVRESDKSGPGPRVYQTKVRADS